MKEIGNNYNITAYYVSNYHGYQFWDDAKITAIQANQWYKSMGLARTTIISIFYDQMRYSLITQVSHFVVEFAFVKK